MLSVAIPTYNRRDRLHHVLSALADQDLDEAFEVIVVSDGSTDGTSEYLASGATPIPVRAFSQPNQGPAMARNAAIEEARGAIILFLDDDVVPEPRLLRRHLEAHARHGADAVVVGPMREPRDHAMSAWIAWEQEMLTKQYDAMEQGDYQATARQFYTGNASVRTKHLRAVGGFDTTLHRAEDIELAFRLDEHGVEFVYEPDASGLHYAERTYEAWRSAAYAYGRNDVIFARAGRRDLFALISRTFRERHWALRCVASIGALGPGTRRICRWVFEPIVCRFPSARRARTVRYALSAIYGVEYYAGVRDELGSTRAFRRLIRRDAARD